MAMYKNAGKKTSNKAKMGFKPCRGCPTPRACAAMGKCKKKA